MTGHMHARPAAIEISSTNNGKKKKTVDAKVKSLFILCKEIY